MQSAQSCHLTVIITERRLPLAKQEQPVMILEELSTVAAQSLSGVA